MGSKANFVLVTADVERATQLRAMGLKVFEFMRKPVQPQELLDTVERAMEHSTPRRRDLTHQSWACAVCRR